MKRRQVLLTIVCVLCSMGSMAALRTPEQAAMIAGRFAAASDMTMAQRIGRAQSQNGTAQPMRLAYTQTQEDQTPAVYVFNNTAKKGYVLVSADDRARTILGYSDDEAFTEENMPDNFRFWLQRYAEEIAHLSGSESAYVAEEDTTTYPVVAPLLGDIEWGQNSPYNDQCPIKEVSNCVTGCVATAASQIMYYYKYPTTGTGSHSYIWTRDSLSQDTLSADFGATTYDWDNMLPSYKSTSTEAQEKAVATLLYHAGVSCNMNYDLSANGGSGANGGKMMAALIEYFGYDKGIHSLSKDYMTYGELLKGMSSELQAKRPLFVTGFTKENKSGHAFIFDGMNSEGYVHVNWGWTGSLNNYFAVTSLAADGVIDGKYDYSYSVTVYGGIQPKKEGSESQELTLVADSIINTGSSRLDKSEQVELSIYKFLNKGVSAVNGFITFTLYQADTVYANMLMNKDFKLEAGYSFVKPVKAQMSFESLPVGQYELALSVTEDAENYYLIRTKADLGAKRFKLVSTPDSIFVDAESYDEADLGFRYAFITDYSQLYRMPVYEIELQTADYKKWNDEVISGTSLYVVVIGEEILSMTGTYRSANEFVSGGLVDGYTRVNYANAGKAYYDTSNKSVMTVFTGANGDYYFSYCLHGQNHLYASQVGIELKNVQVASYDSLSKAIDYATFTEKVVMTLSPETVQQEASKLSADSLTVETYMVGGIVSEVVSTPTYVQEYGKHQFYISADGSKKNQLLCTEFKWLDETDFVTGEELAVGDTVVVVSRMINSQGKSPLLNGGYVYMHNGQKVPETAIDNVEMQVSVVLDGRMLTMRAEEATDFAVMDAVGRMVAVASNTQSLQVVLPEGGVYIVRAGKQVSKLVVK